MFIPMYSNNEKAMENRNNNNQTKTNAKKKSRPPENGRQPS